MGRIIILIASLGVALALAWFGQRLPAPLPVDAPAGVFSAERAMNDVRAVAQRPHPIGSAESARVRAYLLARATQLGLTTELQSGVAVQGQGFGEGDRVLGAGAPVNVLARLPGRDPALPPVLLMSHYDSVPSSPGAADDAMGVAAMFEIARSLRAGAPPARDVYLLFTDGEEAGLFGARLFFARHPLARRLGAVVNLESRGSGGPAIMFETGSNNGALIDLYGDAVPSPAANSLTGFVYRSLPNDTDFTLPRTAGLAGLNMSPIGDQRDYHSPSATPYNLSRDSLQHMGDQALAVTRRLSAAPTLPPRTTNAVYFDVFGLALVRYGQGWGWAVVAAGALVWALAVRRARRTGAARLGAIGRGVAGGVFALMTTALALMLARRLLPDDPGLVGLRPILTQFPLFEAGAALIATGVLAATVAALVRGSRAPGGLPVFGVIVLVVLGGYNPLVAGLGFVGSFAGLWAFRRSGGEPRGLASGFVLLLLLLALFAQTLAPETAFFFAWPGLAGALGLLVLSGVRDAPTLQRTLVALVPGVVVFGAALGFGHLLMVSLGAETPAALAILAPFALALLAPALLPVAGIRGLSRIGLALVVLGAGLWAVVAGREPWSVRDPRPSQVAYLAEPRANRFARVSTLPALDPWSRAALTADGGAITSAPLPELFARRAFVAPARPVTAPEPNVGRGEDIGGAVVSVTAPGSRELRVTINTSADLRGAVVAGVPVPARGRQFRVRWSGAEPLTLRFPDLRRDDVSGSVAAVMEGWPAGALPLSPRPPEVGPWGASDQMIVVTRFNEASARPGPRRQGG